MSVTITTKLDMRHGVVPRVIRVSQYDSDFTLVFELFASDGDFTIESGTTAAIRGTKPSGTGYSAAATLNVAAKTITVTGDAQMTAVKGRCIYEVTLYKNNKELNSANFILQVENAALDANTITDASVLRELDAIIEGAATATQAAEDAEDAADRAEAAAQTLVIDRTLTRAGQAADAKKTGDEIRTLRNDIARIVPGLSSAAKTALLACFAHVAWIDEHGQDYYDALAAALNVATGITLNVYSLAFTSTGSTTQLTATTIPAGGAVTWQSSNTSVATVSSNGMVTAVGYGSATITASADGATATCNVLVAQVSVVSIVPTYTQVGTVYDTDALDSLKANLVVVANWSDSTQTTLSANDYTLTGTLEVGTSTITVSYGGKTATFTVTVSGVSIPVYGVQWDYSNSSPALTRTQDASAFTDPTPSTSLNGSGSSPFDSIMPWAGMKRYNVSNGQIIYSEDDVGFSESAYDTVVHIPEFYYKATKDTTNHVWTWEISSGAKPGFSKHPGSGRYIGRFMTGGDSSAVYSKVGATPLGNVGLPDFRTYSHNKGANWYILDYASWCAVLLLYLVEYANFDSQTQLGVGAVNTGGVTNQCIGSTTGAAYHTLKSNRRDEGSGPQNMYRWIEAPFSGGACIIDGCVINYGEVYVGVSDTGYTGNISELTDTGIQLPASGNITGFGYSSAAPWVFIADTSNTVEDYTGYVTDRVTSNSETDIAAARVGGMRGSIDRAGMYGMFYMIGDNVPTRENAGHGSRLMFVES